MNKSNGTLGSSRFGPWLIAVIFIFIFICTAIFLIFIKKDKPRYEMIDGKKVLVITCWDWNVPRLRILEEYIDKYEKLNNGAIKIKTLHVGWSQYWPKIVASSVGQKPPTIANMHNSRHSQLVSLLEPFPDDLFPLEQMRKDYYLFDAAFVHEDEDGQKHFYYMPSGLMLGLVFYNKEIWEDNNLTEADYPKSWDEFLAIAKKLTVYEQDNSDEIRVAGFNANGGTYPNFSTTLIDLLYQFDGRLYSDDEQRIQFDSEALKKAAKLLLGFYDEGVCDLRFLEIMRSFASYQSENKESDSYSAMVYCWTWLANFLRQENPDLRWGVFAMPKVDPNGFYGRTNYECAQGVLAAANPEDKQAAFAFLKWLHDQDDYIVKLSIKQGTLPGRLDLWEHPAIDADPVLRAAKEVIASCVFPGEIPDWMVDHFVSFDDMLIKGVDLEEAFRITNELLNTRFSEMSRKWITEKESINN